MKSTHTPVLIKEVVDALHLRSGMTVVDATFGGGGHSKEILKRIRPGGTLIALDQDEMAFESCKDLKRENEENARMMCVRENFSQIRNVLGQMHMSEVDAVIADLGLSSDQIENRERGFSFQVDAKLDMRMDQRKTMTAERIVNDFSQEMLEEIFRKYGEERYARKIAEGIVTARKRKSLTSTMELVAVIERSVPERYKHQRIHFATRSFQSLRIAVNKEDTSLEIFLQGVLTTMRRGGRLAVITFHSGEDRTVKQFFRANAGGCICPKEVPVCQCEGKRRLAILTKKPVRPTEAEIAQNPRSRSAKLRVAEKV